MVTTIKIPEARVAEYFTKFINESVLTYVGLSIHTREDKEHLKKFEEIVRDTGFNEPELLLYYTDGRTMNNFFGLTGSNAYIDDLTIVFVPGVYDIGFKMASGGRWFDDIVSNNSIKQNAINDSVEPDFDIIGVTE